ncbi:PH domain-containing protein [Jatrophihabitans sp.]|uniref:PH domain-containing protein n=1 Tax=Jatrophihabitans sp. TaxID=1932789 RepID=UPI0030C6A8F9|nr:cytoplasmic protein [Jatrophihabitans sp.]
MGIMSGITGNAGPMSPQEATAEFSRLLSQGEQIYAAYNWVRDAMLFTNGRMILVDKQGITGKKIEYLSIPYRSISRYAVQTEGHLMAEATMQIWIEGVKDPIEKEFNSSVDIYQVQGVLSAFAVSR